MRCLTAIASTLLAGTSLLICTACDTYVGVGRPDRPNYALSGDYYDYTYYPDSEVYYYAPQHVYYWRDGNAWQHGRDVPSRVHFDRTRSVPLHLRTERPYENHDRIRTEHPRHEMHDRDNDRDRH